MTMPNFYIALYQPLASTRKGFEASERKGIPPFVDGSIRREPDLEHAYPSISCICRGRNFAPRLRPGDHVAYVTWKGRYQGLESHWRLTAVLRVWKLFEDHKQAAQWYFDRDLPVPSNCMIYGNPSLKLSESHQKVGKDLQRCGAPNKRAWDAVYKKRARQHPRFVVCKPLCRELSYQAPAIDNDDWKYLFGQGPSRNPRTQSFDDFHRFMNYFDLHI